MNTHVFHLAIISAVLLLLCGPVSAYYLELEAPAQVKVGEPVNVTGTTNIPPPDKIDLVFSHSINIPVEIDRQSIQITEKGDNTFNATFSTVGLEKGNYKVEALSQTQRNFSGGSHSLRVIKLIDRSGLIRFTSPTWQEYDKTLQIDAKISGYTDNAIQMDVMKGDEVIFGPESIPVSRGVIKYELPIEEPGTYNVSFTDYDGFIGKYTIVSEEKDNYTTETEVLPVESIATGTPVPELSSSLGSIQTRATNEPKPVSTENPVEKEKPKTISGISASAESSRDSPAYFLIATNETPITIQTSDNSDWVFEYKTSPESAPIKINDEMGDEAETVTITDSVSQIYLKAYPYSYKASEEVTIRSDKAQSVALSDDAAKAFGVPPKYGSEKKEKETPIPLWVVLTGLVSSLFIFVKRR